jgi:uncharacterized protein (DUF983 family)
MMKLALRCRCPRCGEGRLYRSLYNLNLNDRCPNCGLNLADNDSADGPAVFLIFILGFLLVPAAVLLDWAFSPPLWLHAILWGLLALMVTVGALKPLKSLVLLIQYRTRPETWQP